MKRLLCVTLALSVAGAAFIGCQKDGVFNPKNKISKIYRTEKGSKVLSEVWTWDGKTLNNVACYLNDSTMEYKWYYFYEKKQVVRIENTLGLSYITITYSGSNYDKVEFYDKFDKKLRSYAYTYDGKKVSKIDFTSYKNPSKSMDVMDYRFLSAFIPMAILEETDKQIKNSPPSKSDGDVVYNYTLKYDGDNLSEWKIVDNNDPNKQLEMTYQYEQYDKNVNPYYASFPNIDGMNIATPCFYKNNPTKVTLTQAMNGKAAPTTTYDYSYQYNGKKFPTESIKKATVEGTVIRSDTNYYEYN